MGESIPSDMQKMTQISLHSLSRVFVVHMKKNFASLAIQNVPSEDSDQPAQMSRLI